MMHGKSKLHDCTINAQDAARRVCNQLSRELGDWCWHALKNMIEVMIYFEEKRADI